MSDAQIQSIAEPILIAGFGSIGRRHFQNLKSLGCREFVFYRTRKGTLSDDEIRGFPSTTRLDEALSYRPKIAVITNPSALHLEVGIQAAESGCDLYIEKPVSHCLDRAEELVSIVQKRHRVTMIGCQFRFHPLLADLREQLSQGRLGQVIGAFAQWGEYLPEWHPWEDHRRSYSARTELGGGVILTLIHPLDYLYWIFGPVRRVRGANTGIPSLETSSAEDWADITLEFSSGVIGSVHLDYVQRPPVHQLTVVGDAGRAQLDFHAGELTWCAIDGQLDRRNVGPNFDRNSLFVASMEHFLTCVATRHEPLVPLADGIAVLRMALDARRTANDFTHA